MEMPFGGTFASDTFETGTRAAAWGGTTTIVDFVVQAHGQRVQDQVALWHEKAGGNCAVDYALPPDHRRRQRRVAQGDGRADRRGHHQLQAVHGLSRRVPLRDGQILRAMQTAAGNGGLIMMHAENGSAIDVLVQQALARGRHRAVLPRRHPALADRAGGHPPRGHAGRHHRRAALRRARRRRSRRWPASPRPATPGQNVFGETCPQYLYLSLEEHLGGAWVRGRQVGLLDPVARPAPRATRTRCGDTSTPVTSRRSLPTTARSA